MKGHALLLRARRSVFLAPFPALGATTNAILELAGHLRALQVDKVVLESTSDYWRPFFYLLEAAGVHVELVDAREVKNAPGRRGWLLGSKTFPATAAGYRALLRWARTFGAVRRAGVNCTGSYGAALARHLVAAQVEVLEVRQPDKAQARTAGTSARNSSSGRWTRTIAGRRCGNASHRRTSFLPQEHSAGLILAVAKLGEHPW